MLVNTITFEMRDFSTGIAEEFIVENTGFNYELINSHRCTRDIQFTQLFDFEFDRKEHTPKFMQFAEIFEAAFIENENVNELDEIDEMVGIYA